MGDYIRAYLDEIVNKPAEYIKERTYYQKFF